MMPRVPQSRVGEGRLCGRGSLVTQGLNRTALALGLSGLVHVVGVGLVVWRAQAVGATPAISPSSAPHVTSTVRVSVMERAVHPAAANEERPVLRERANPTPAPQKLRVEPTTGPGLPVALSGETEAPPASTGSVESPAAGPETSGAAENTEGSPGQPQPAGPSDQVRQSVHAQLQNAANHCYPAAAKRFSVRGTVGLSFCVSSASVEQIAVVTSSGSTLLDSAAHDCVVREAAPFAPEASGFCFSVPVRFGAQ